jgi:hypothetical protein
VTTLDVLSGGRVGLGIGAAWNEDESRGLGFDFPPTAERFGDYDEIEKTAIFAMDPASTADDIAATANGAADAGFTAAYVYARNIIEPGHAGAAAGPWW